MAYNKFYLQRHINVIISVYSNFNCESLLTFEKKMRNKNVTE
jgi:hypothetical protein